MIYTTGELDHIYCGWTGQLHNWVKEFLGAQINCQYDPLKWQMKIWSGEARFVFGSSGVFGIDEPTDAVKISLPKAEDEPTKEKLDEVFRSLCIASARCLGMPLKRRLLWVGKSRRSRRKLSG